MRVAFSLINSTVSSMNNLLVGNLSNTFRCSNMRAILLNTGMSKGLWYGFGRKTL
jgi:hypothetical protein